MSYISVYRIELDKDIMVLLSGREIRSDADIRIPDGMKSSFLGVNTLAWMRGTVRPRILKMLLHKGKIFSSGIVMKLMDVGLKWN